MYVNGTKENPAAGMYVEIWYLIPLRCGLTGENGPFNLWISAILTEIIDFYFMPCT